MNINKNNYETYFIDYFDGNLSAELTAELFLFLESNPELKKEFDSFEAITLDDNDEFFPLKDALKRGAVNDENVNWYMAAATEGDLTADEKVLLEEYLNANPDRKKDTQLFNMVRLVPGNEVYEDKNALKQPVPFYMNRTRVVSYAIAAVLMLSVIGGAYYSFIRTNKTSTTEIAAIPDKTESDNENQEQNIQSSNISIDNSSDINNTADDNGSINQEDINTGTSTLPGKIKNSVPETDTNKPRQRIEQVKTIQTQTIGTPVLATLDPESRTNSDREVMEIDPDIETAGVSELNNEQYLSVWEAIRKGAKNNLNKMSEPENDVLASIDNNENKPVRLFNILGKGIEKVSNDKVNVESNYDEDGKLSAFEFAAGKFKIERKKGF